MANTTDLPVFIAFLGTETNSFAPIPTGLTSFVEAGMTRRDGSLNEDEDNGSSMGAFRKLAEADGRSVIESVATFAQPSGMTVQSVWEQLRNLVLDDLRAAGPVSAVMLGLHGAMMASECDDCEGDLIARVREIVGPDVPIGAELDPHCHLTEKMVANADAILIMKEYPHTDWDDRARELYSILTGPATPVSAIFDCRMVGFYPTTLEPMKDWVQRMKDTEREPGILSISLAHGFPWGDHPDTGTHVLVIADGDLELARTTAERLGRDLYAMRDELLPAMPTIAEAIDSARTLDGLIVMGDTADNPGGGAPSDTTHLLRALIDADIGPCAFGAIYDPGAVRICEEAGVGAKVMLRIGGKLGVISGEPFDIEVEVAALEPDHHQSIFGGRAPLGPSAWVRIGDVDVVLVSIRVQAFGRDLFTGLGITLHDKRVVAVKSSEHFRADFGPIADHVISVATPGAIQMDFTAIPYRHKLDMDFHPRLPDPLATGN